MQVAQLVARPEQALYVAKPTTNIWLAFGGNQGDVLATFTNALRLIPEQLGGHWQAISSVYRTSPLQLAGMDGEVGGAYWNMTCHLEVTSSLPACWQYFQYLERLAGRLPGSKWAPRPLDIDVLWVDPLPSHVPGLHLPHPRLHERGFVLAPMLEIAADLVLPTFGCSIATLWQRLPVSEQKMLGRLPPLLPGRKRYETIVEKSALD